MDTQPAISAGLNAGPAPLLVENISKSFAGVQVLKPLHLALEQGEMLALLGPSGCGKTTTLRLVAGFETPDTGRILIAGRDVTGLPPNRRGLGMMFQNYSLFPHMTVGENVAFGLKMHGVGKAERTARVRTMLHMVRLDHLVDRQVHQLSGGQQQRIALARSLATEPSLLLLDEPLGALDKNLRESMQFELRHIQRKLGITSILVTHDQEEALTMSDRVAVMAQGEVVQIGRPAEVYDRPRNRFVAEFLGTANIFTGTVTKADGPHCWAILLDAPAGAVGRVENATALTIGRPMAFAVRPERLVLEPSATGGLPAVLQDVVFRGAYYVCELLAAGQERPWFAYCQTQPAAGPGSRVGIRWDPAHAVILHDPP